MRYFTPQNLQQRISLFVLIPIFAILVIMGGAGFFYAKSILFEQWSETVFARLKAAAHSIDMRLIRPLEYLKLLRDMRDMSSARFDHQVHEFIVEELRSMEGVVAVYVDWPPMGETRTNVPDVETRIQRHMMKGHDFTVTLPAYSAELQDETVSLIIEFRNAQGAQTGQVEVVMAFHDLISEIMNAPWWQTNKAYLVDSNGNILSQSRTNIADNSKVKRVFGTESELERRTLAELSSKPYGTLLGSGTPPKEVAGFYRLELAPWILVIVAPGERALQPILQFSVYFLTGGLLFTAVILLFIRVVVGRTANAIKEVSEATNRLARGEFGEPLPVKSADEVGELIKNFNMMTSQLQKGLDLQESMNIAREVQMNFLPQPKYSFPGVEMAGLCKFCEETGGDFYDIVEMERSPNRLAVVIGDVVGHGIGAALLMATIRAALRSRLTQPGSLSDVISDVNRQISFDTASSNSFVSMFLLVIDTRMGSVEWIRAGHDPAVVYLPRLDEFRELKGLGVVLGLDENYEYVTNRYDLHDAEQLIFICSDGVWEVENTDGEPFGKDRVKSAIAAHYDLTAEAIAQKLFKEIDIFRAEAPFRDDITMVVMKIAGAQGNAPDVGSISL